MNSRAMRILSPVGLLPNLLQLGRHAGFLSLAHRCKYVSYEMNPASLSARAQEVLFHSSLNAQVCIGDNQPHSLQSARFQALEQQAVGGLALAFHGLWVPHLV